MAVAIGVETTDGVLATTPTRPVAAPHDVGPTLALVVATGGDVGADKTGDGGCQMDLRQETPLMGGVLVENQAPGTAQLDEAGLAEIGGTSALPDPRQELPLVDVHEREGDNLGIGEGHVVSVGLPHIAQVTARLDQLTVGPREEASIDGTNDLDWHEEWAHVDPASRAEGDYFQISISEALEDAGHAVGEENEVSSGHQHLNTSPHEIALHGREFPKDSLAGLLLQEFEAYRKMKTFCAQIVKTLAPPLLKEIQASTLRADAVPFTPRRSAWVAGAPPSTGCTKSKEAENVLIRALGLVPDDLQVDEDAVRELHQLLGSPLRVQHVRIIAGLFGKTLPEGPALRAMEQTVVS